MDLLVPHWAKDAGGRSREVEGGGFAQLPIPVDHSLTSAGNSGCTSHFLAVLIAFLQYLQLRAEVGNVFTETLHFLTHFDLLHESSHYPTRN